MLFVLLAFPFASRADEVVACRVFVSPVGKEGASGDSGDPVESLDSALSVVRKLRFGGNLPKCATVEIQMAAGVYPIVNPIRLGPADSHLRIKGVEGLTILRGGRSIPRFQARDDGVWESVLPEGLYFEQLWVNGRRAIRAKSPNEGYFYMRRPLSLEKNPLNGNAEDLFDRGFWARPEDLEGLTGLSTSELSNVVIRTYHSWYTTTTALRYAGVDGAVIGTSTRGRQYFSWKEYLPRYELENYRAALDSPGEWFLDAPARRIYYIPRAGEVVDTAEAEVPVVERILIVKGDRPSKGLVCDVRFEGVSFDLAGYKMPAEGGGGEQSAPEFDATILLDDVKDVAFDHCSLTRTGHYGFWFRRGCRQCSLRHSRVEDLGAGAVRIGDRDWSKDELPSGLTAFVSVEDSILRHGGQIVPSACGVVIYNASDCAVVHNEISDFFYTGVSVGWTWGYRETPTRRNRINWNHIHDIGQGVLCDMGGVYLLGKADGTEVIGNHIHDIWSYDYTGYGGWGLYADEGSAGIRFESNLVHHVKSGAACQHYGRDNVFRNNIFAFGEDGMVRRTRDEAHHCFTFERNIVYQDGSRPLVTGIHSSIHDVTNVTLRSNVWWSRTGIPANAFFGRSWNEWRATGQDAGSIVSDPQFFDVSQGDFRLRQTSSAFATGFRAWNYLAAGVNGTDAGWRQEANRRTAGSVRPIVVPERFDGVRDVRFSFEKVQMRDDAIGFLSLMPTGMPGSFALADRSDVSGGHCLEFRDREDYRFPWEPHAFVPCVGGQGAIMVKMSLNVSRSAQVQAEMRDYRADNGRQYAAGPMFWIADGRLSAGGRSVEVPYDEWFDVELSADTSVWPVSWSIAVRKREKPSEFIGELSANGDFREMTWFGFMSPAKVKSTWRLDDFSMGFVSNGKQKGKREVQK